MKCRDFRPSFASSSSHSGLPLYSLMKLLWPCIGCGILLVSLPELNQIPIQELLSQKRSHTSGIDVGSFRGSLNAATGTHEFGLGSVRELTKLLQRELMLVLETYSVLFYIPWSGEKFLTKCLGAKQWKRNGWSTHDLLKVKESSVDIGSNPIRTWAMNQVLNSWTYLNLTKGWDKPIAWKRDFLQVTHSSQPCLELSLANHSLNLLRYESSALLYHLALVGLADRHGKAFFSPPI